MRLASNFLKSITAALALSASANATFFWDVEAVAGDYGPITLGEDIQLDACGANIQLVQNRNDYTISICNDSSDSLYFNDLSNVSLNWGARNVDTDTFEWLTTPVPANDIRNVQFGNVATNSALSVATGSGTFFNTVGTYVIALYVVGLDNSNLTVTSNGPLGGGTANFGSDSTNDLFGTALSANSTLNNGLDFSDSFSITAPPTPVPEPESLLVLLPALAVIARRQRRRRSTV